MSDNLAQLGSANPARISLLGLPLEAGAGVPGACMGPAALRTAGLAPVLRELGHSVEDHGDLWPTFDAVDTTPAPAGAMRNFAEVSAWTQSISTRAYELVGDGSLPIFMGGDHALSMGTVNGVARHAKEEGRELFVLWIDAHADYNTPFTSPSGNMHGMPVAALCGEDGLAPVFGDVARTTVDPTHFHMLGIRSIDTGERTLLRERGVNVMDMRMIDEFGIARLLRPLIETVKERNGLLHVSLDVDFIDPSLAPGVGTVVPGGANYREAHLIMEMLHDSGLASSLDIVELNPFLDDRGKSAMLLVDLVASLFGRQIIDQPSRIAV
jgi:arginase